MEALYGPQDGEPRVVWNGHLYDVDEELALATRMLVERLRREIVDLAERAPACSRVHGAPARGQRPWCPETGCQAWFDEVGAWHDARFGRRHVGETVHLVLSASPSRAGATLTRSLDPVGISPAVVATGPVRSSGMDGDAWSTWQVAIHRDASIDDMRELLERLAADGVRLRQQGSRARRGDRAGRLDHPHRNMLWWYRRARGATYPAIAEEWDQLTAAWSSGRVQPAVASIEYPAFLEWQRQDAGGWRPSAAAVAAALRSVEARIDGNARRGT